MLLTLEEVCALRWLCAQCGCIVDENPKPPTTRGRSKLFMTSSTCRKSAPMGIAVDPSSSTDLFTSRRVPERRSW